MITLSRDYRGFVPEPVGLVSPWFCRSTGDVVLPVTIKSSDVAPMLMDIFDPAKFTRLSRWYDYVQDTNSILKTRGIRVLGDGAYMTAYEYMGVVYKINNKSYTHTYSDGAYDWTLAAMYANHRNTPVIHSVLRDGNRFCMTMEKLVYVQDYMNCETIYQVFDCIMGDKPSKLAGLLRATEYEAFTLLDMLKRTKGLTKAAYDLHDYNVMARPLMNGGFDFVVTDPFCGSSSYTYAMTDGFEDTKIQS